MAINGTMVMAIDGIRISVATAENIAAAITGAYPRRIIKRNEATAAIVAGSTERASPSVHPFQQSTVRREAYGNDGRDEREIYIAGEPPTLATSLRG